MPCAGSWIALAESPVQRLFFALWPAPETARRIWQATAKLVPRGVGRRLPAQQLHLTLAYLGQQDARQLHCVSEVASRLQAQAFNLTLDQTGHFPRPQVVWLGASQTPAALAALQDDLVSQLTQYCGYQPESRPFLPHVTLIRKVRRVDLPERIPPLAWPVASFALVRSDTRPSGAEYSVLRAWPLDTSQV